ncbi:unnamed protein product [Didymodactylos carnosus]|uniref:Major facilitator superfamily associated domain-containing protein n=2 Tax=Didymodactylos carnosus TaxID=1234261 RepID=A0A8S2KF80_9BILA|nr:unnamed protein product [Didymodactylos carnosus]CAF3839141.1 unnamed protein product [Didymodactylos carnosus]
MSSLPGSLLSTTNSECTITCSIPQLCHTMDPYLFLFIDEIAPCSSHRLIGWMWLIACTSELCAFFFSGCILNKVGTDLASIIILLAYSARFASYYLIRHPNNYLPIETFYFFTFGIRCALVAKRAHDIAPHGLAGTLQGIASGLLGLGRATGLLICSFIYISIRPLRLRATREATSEINDLQLEQKQTSLQPNEPLMNE